MTLTKAVVVVWAIDWRRTEMPDAIASLLTKLQDMTTAEKTDGKKDHWGSPQVSEYRFTDQVAAEEFVLYMKVEFPAPEAIDSTNINNL